MVNREEKRLTKDPRTRVQDGTQDLFSRDSTSDIGLSLDNGQFTLALRFHNDLVSIGIIRDGPTLTSRFIESRTNEFDCRLNVSERSGVSVQLDMGRESCDSGSGRNGGCCSRDVRSGRAFRRHRVSTTARTSGRCRGRDKDGGSGFGVDGHHGRCSVRLEVRRDARDARGATSEVFRRSEGGHKRFDVDVEAIW